VTHGEATDETGEAAARTYYVRRRDALRVSRIYHQAVAPIAP
jgi:hypothetical protein